MRKLIVDIPNLFFRGVAANKAAMETMTSEESKGYALHICLMSLRRHYNNIKPQEMALAFEGGSNWRKKYTSSDECYSKVPYKGNRTFDESMVVLFDILDQFISLCREYTSLPILKRVGLEADDCIAQYVLENYNEHEVVILSGDKDFVQLLKFDNVRLINPDNSTERTVESVCGVDDAEYFMFEKCFRGDTGDNVISAYPRIRSAKLQKAWNGDVVLLNAILDHTWQMPLTEEGAGCREMSVQQLFWENDLLMNLTSQPENIKRDMVAAYAEAYETCGKYKHFDMLRHLSGLGLNKIADELDNFVGMFSNTQYRNIDTAGTPIKVFDDSKGVKIKGVTF